MTWETGLSLAAIGVVLVAIMLFWNAGLACYRYDSPARRRLRITLLLGGGGSLLLAGSLVLGVVFDGNVLGVFIVLFIVLLFVALAFLLSWLQFRTSRRQSLVWVLAAAAESGVPLHDAAHAFADENAGDKQSRNLSMLLHAGAPLPAALKMANVALPIDSQIAVDAGHRLNLLGPCMQRLLADSHGAEDLVREAIERIWYALALAVFTGTVGFFLLVKIYPVMAVMSSEFGIANSSATFYAGFSEYWVWPLLLLAAAAMPLMALSFVGGLYYIGLLPPNFPGVGVLARRLDSARLLRVLSVASDNKKSLQESLRVLTLFYPRLTIRARLHQAGMMVSAGTNWITSLKSQGLITESDAAVMESAQRAGNLSWAMNDLAATSTRRFCYRLKILSSFVFPIIACCAGMVVLFFALGVFGPMTAILEALI